MRLPGLFIVVALAAAGMVAPGLADIVHLTDGTQVEGEVRKVPGGFSITQADGTVTTVPSERVRLIDVRGGRAADPSDGQSLLTAVRRLADTSADVDLIIGRYKQFLTTFSQSPLAPEAAEELKTWEVRKQQGMVKMGDAWVPADEVQQIREQAIALARQAATALRESRFRDADALIAQSLRTDPTCPAALYLQGILAGRQNQWPAARRHFESAAAALPGDAAILNNLAVAHAQMKQTGAAIRVYAEALDVAPGERLILDNVAEFLNTQTPADIQRNFLAQRLVTQFNAADLKLQEKMGPLGMFRWGATWVSRQQLDELRTAEQRINAQLAELKGRLESLRAQDAGLAEEIEFKEQRLKSMENATWVRDTQGRWYRLRLPDAYDEIQREVGFLRGKRKAMEVEAENIQKQMRTIRTSLPTPPFSGLQRMFDESQMPVRAPLKAPAGEAPATQPAVPGASTAP